jgi:hypothetical protein
MIIPALSEIVNELTEKYSTRWVARASGVSSNMIRKVARGEAGLDLARVARLSRRCIRQKNDSSLVALLTGEDVVDEPLVNGCLNDECLDMDAVTVEARRAFIKNDRTQAVRQLVAMQYLLRRFTSEIRRMQ